MTKVSVSAVGVQELKKEFRKDPASLQARYDTLEAEQQIIVALLDLRRAQNLTQADLAELMGTSQANISKLESGKFNPSVAFLKRLAAACDVRLSVYLR